MINNSESDLLIDRTASGSRETIFKRKDELPDAGNLEDLNVEEASSDSGTSLATKATTACVDRRMSTTVTERHLSCASESATLLLPSSSGLKI